MPTAIYLLDSTVFIESARRYYAFDIAPPFWHALIEYADNGKLQSIDRVKVELNRLKDELTNWANGHFHQWFVSSDQPDVIEAYAQVMTWAHAQAQFTDRAKSEFAAAENADAWVIAYSHAKGCIVVTDEKFNPDIKREIKIPNVCRGPAFDIRCIDTFTMLRELGFKFR